jgi:hypothetical protein
LIVDEHGRNILLLPLLLSIEHDHAIVHHKQRFKHRHKRFTAGTVAVREPSIVCALLIDSSAERAESPRSRPHNPGGRQARATAKERGIDGEVQEMSATMNSL